MNNTRHASARHCCSVAALWVAVWVLLVSASSAAAQSTEIDFPSPVVANEISGVIPARDIGDARLTRHFYALTGTAGDLVLTVESQNLNGDVDLFTAGSLRPLAKISMYAREVSAGTSKSVYLRRRESLILRVEARSASDNEGTYRIRFAGAFEPISNPTPTPDGAVPVASTPSPRGRKVRRVTSVGGRIEEPETEVAAAEKAPEPAPTPEPAPPVATAETPAPAPSEPRPAEPRLAAKSARARRPRGRARSPRVRATPRPRAKESPPTSEPAADSAPSEPPTTQPAMDPRLIIETRDGTRIERYMSTVRRVTVANGQIIVVTKDGRTERQSMANVLRMSIEP